MKRSLFRCGAAAPLLALATATLVHAKDGPAQEKVTLETTWTNITCTVTLPGGASTSTPCSSLSFSAVVPPGGTVSISATLNWTYTDDGLALDRPFGFQVDPFGLSLQYVDHESALIAVRSMSCGRSICPPPHIDYRGPGFAGFVLGSNDEPDALTGSRTYTASATVRDTWFEPSSASVFLDSFVMVQEVTAIPEPSTHALVFAGLLGLAAVRRRSLGCQAALPRHLPNNSNSRS